MMHETPTVDLRRSVQYLVLIINLTHRCDSRDDFHVIQGLTIIAEAERAVARME